MKTLDETEQADNTLVVFVADHGDGNASHRWNQKSALWEECVRVPLIFRQPGVVTAGRVDSGLVSTGLDLMPTLCDFAGAKMPPGYAGVSLKGNCLGETTQSPHNYLVTETSVGRGRGFSVRTKRYKYIVYSQGQNPEQFFDLQEDPGEMKNLIADPAGTDEVKHHRDLLRQWCLETKDEFAVPASPTS
jgi:arylsulfatase A-like enzyme